MFTLNKGSAQKQTNEVLNVPWDYGEVKFQHFLTITLKARSDIVNGALMDRTIGIYLCHIAANCTENKCD